MRLSRTLFLLFSILCGCGSVKIVLKSPVESRCASAGLKGCPELTEGVLLYVEGKEDEGKDMLIRGAADNSPAKVKKFARAIKELKQIPGASNYAKPLFKVADILAGAKGKGKKGGAGPGAGPDEQDAPEGEGPQEGGVVVLARASDRAPCGGMAGLGYCVRVAAGPLVLTDLTTGAGCPAEVVVASARVGGSVEIPRWLARNPTGVADERAIVRTGEVLVVGVQAGGANDTRCSVTWAGYRPTDGR